VTSRRTMLDPVGHACAATVTVTDLEQLAEREHATADPVLLTPGRCAYPGGDRGAVAGTHRV